MTWARHKGRRRARGRQALHGIALAVFALVGAACGGGGDDADSEIPPSFILVSLDTLRADHVGDYGYERATTPYLDALADESILYEQTFATAPWTLISHMTMFTGLYPDQHGVVEDKLSLSPDVPTLAEKLRAKGYQTIALFNPGWIHERHGFDRGFDVFRGHADAAEAAVHLKEELDRLNPKRPFFLFLHLFDIHSVPMVEDEGLYYSPKPPYDRIFLEDAPDRFAGVGWEDVWLGRKFLTETQVEGLVALYDGGVRLVDDYMKLWVEDWRARGLLDNTLLTVTSDHGEPLAQRRGQIRGHGGLFQDGLRVPMLLRYPDGRGAGTRVPDPVSHVDLMPTFLDYAGFEGDANAPGYSLLSDLPTGRVVLASKPPSKVQVRWPYKVWRQGNGDVRVFDLVADPKELDPIEGPKIPKQVQAAERAEFSGEKTYAPAIPAPEMSADHRAELDALGYAGK